MDDFMNENPIKKYHNRHGIHYRTELGIGFGTGVLTIISHAKNLECDDFSVPFCDFAVSKIEAFFPYGGLISMKTGLGQRLLEEMVKDSKQNSCKAIFVYTLEEKMKDFLTRNGFLPYKWIEHNYYKILTP